MKKIVVGILFFAALACHKENVSADVPRPVRKDIDEFSKNSTCNDARVDEYKFQDHLVYVFEPGTCGADMSSAVEDADGKNLGALGGFTGNMVINGEKFETATFIRTVWNKNP